MLDAHPRYPDDCGHGLSYYVGTCVETMNGRNVDVYVEPPRHQLDGPALVCLRYGRDGEYYSAVRGFWGARGDYGDSVGDLAAFGLLRLYLDQSIGIGSAHGVSDIPQRDARRALSEVAEYGREHLLPDWRYKEACSGQS
jgi:hypothetical protein